MCSHLLRVRATVGRYSVCVCVWRGEGGWHSRRAQSGGHSRWAQSVGTVGGHIHSRWAQSVGTVGRHSRSAQSTGTVDRHSRQAQSAGIWQAQSSFWFQAAVSLGRSGSLPPKHTTPQFNTHMCVVRSNYYNSIHIYVFVHNLQKKKMD